MNFRSKRVTRIELATTAWKAVVFTTKLHPHFQYDDVWRETESNRRHMELQSIALPTELPSQLLREQDLNLRPSGYEPDELPCCSTPRHKKATIRYAVLSVKLFTFLFRQPENGLTNNATLWCCDNSCKIVAPNDFCHFCNFCFCFIQLKSCI